MEKVYKDLMLASVMEVVSLPALLYVYEPNGILFWLLLMLLDSYLLKRMPFFEVVKLMGDEPYKKQRNQILFIQLAFLVGLGIVAMKSLPLAGILLVNDLIVDFLSFFMAVNDKKNK